MPESALSPAKRGRAGEGAVPIRRWLKRRRPLPNPPPYLAKSATADFAMREREKSAAYPGRPTSPLWGGRPSAQRMDGWGPTPQASARVMRQTKDSHPTRLADALHPPHQGEGGRAYLPAPLGPTKPTFTSRQAIRQVTACA